MAAERDYSKRASWRVLKELVRPHWHMAVAACVLLLADIVGISPTLPHSEGSKDMGKINLCIKMLYRTAFSKLQHKSALSDGAFVRSPSIFLLRLRMYAYFFSNCLFFAYAFSELI